MPMSLTSEHSAEEARLEMKPWTVAGCSSLTESRRNSRSLGGHRRRQSNKTKKRNAAEETHPQSSVRPRSSEKLSDNAVVESPRVKMAFNVDFASSCQAPMIAESRRKLRGESVTGGAAREGERTCEGA